MLAVLSRYGGFALYSGWLAILAGNAGYVVWICWLWFVALMSSKAA
jgi:hypothetical protein